MCFSFWSFLSSGIFWVGVWICVWRLNNLRDGFKQFLSSDNGFLKTGNLLFFFAVTVKLKLETFGTGVSKILKTMCHCPLEPTGISL